MKKVFYWKAFNKNFEYVEVKIAHTNYKRAEKSLLKTCMQANLTPIEYLGWEEIKGD